MITTLTILYCLSARPAECTVKRRELQNLAGLPMACAIEGQQIAAEFVAEHPGFFVARVLCETGNRRREDA